MLEIEFKYFLNNKAILIKNYTNKYIVIVGEAVVGVYDTNEEAYTESTKKYDLGTFLIRFCDVKGESHIQNFHSRAIFA